MGLRIQTNVAAMNAHRNLGISDTALGKSLERLSSGYRINSAADDASGLSISASLLTQVRSLTVASQNTSQANSLLQVAEGGMDSMGNILGRMKELATQAASANNSGSLSDLNNELTALIGEMERISQSTTFNGTALLTGYGTKTSSEATISSLNAYGLDVTNAGAHIYSVQMTTSGITIEDMSNNVTQTISTRSGGGEYNYSQFGIKFSTTDGAAQSATLALLAAELDGGSGFSVTATNATFQVGEKNDTNYQISFQIDDVTTATLSVDTGTINLSTASAAQTALTKIDSAVTALASSRAEVGALQNRLSYTYATIATSTENLSAAASVIKDVDMAMEMTVFTKNQILLQAGTAMLAQANMAPQGVLSLFG